jgi:hypothetical protein
MGQSDIERALNTKFATLGYTFVSYPNGPVVDPGIVQNYSVTTLYGEGLADAVGSNAANRFVGIYQVTVRCPADGTGVYAGMTSVNAILTAFTLGTILTYGTAQVHCKMSLVRHFGLLGDSWYTLVVRIPFWANA